MTGIETLSATPAAQAIAWALVHFLWQGALVGIAAAGALAALGKGKASVRYSVALGALVLLLACPVVTVLRMAPPAGSVIPISPVIPVSPATASAVHPAGSEEGLVTTASVPAAFSESSPIYDVLPAALPWVFGLWLAGVAGLSLYHLGGWRLTRILRRRGTRPVPADLETKLRGLARRMGVVRAVELLESSAVQVPAVIGWLKPVILVPGSALAGLSPQQLEAILAHELAHVRRHDYLVNLLQTVVETLLFYHPAVWWVSAQIRRERENCCDDLAVAVCGDPLGYARALANLEGLRVSSPRLALAADGGSLVDRVRRLVGVPARSRRPWLAGVLALSLLPAGVTFDFAQFSDPADAGSSSGAAESPAPPRKASLAPASLEKPAPPAPPRASAPGRQGTERRGTWSAERQKDGKIHLRMKMRGTWGSWEESNSHPVSAFKGLGAGPEVRFDMPRDAGTFHFEGRFEGGDGTGFFTFEGNPAYVRQMAALGYQVSDSRLMELALHDVSLDFVRQMKELDYGDVSLDRLVEFRIHGVSPEFVRGMADSGYRQLPAERLVEFRIHGVNPDFVRGMVDAGYRDLPADRLVEFRIHGVNPQFVQGFTDAGYRNLPADRLVEFRIHGVTPEFVRKAASKGYKNLSPEDLVELKIMGRLDR
ncbi:MAG TPA: M56 family metallopeptidase [Thermoanaerobaculia bacterium]|nr:M56 family metallopeptidase [Thermoanaerobaculia bacterium]